MRETRIKPIGANTFWIRLERNPDGGLRGSVEGGILAQEIEFSSISKMILLLDTAMDTESGIVMAKPTRHGEPTFILEVLFRQNCSWQGRMIWPREGKEASFRSVLELIVLIETTMSP